MLLALLGLYYFILGLTTCNEVYHGGIISDGFNLDPFQDDPHCKHHTHKFYRRMKCYPEISPNFKCPTSYKCGTLENRSPDLCYYEGRSYPVGYNLTQDIVDFHTPCLESCQCVRMYEGARFYCPRTAHGCSSPPGCRQYSFMEDFQCCERGVASCIQKGKQDDVKCVFGGRSYSEGERFFPTDDITCTQCICTSQFNGSIAAPACQQFSCAFELWGDTPVMLTRGCIPVFLSDEGCCPVTYRCPISSDRVIKVKKSSFFLHTDRKCRFGNLTLEVGDQLSAWTETNAKGVECSCRVPPLASCVHRHFVLSDDMRRELAGVNNAG